MKISTKLSIIYIVTTYLCLFMLTWIFVFPATAYVKSSEDTYFQRAVLQLDNFPSNVPPNLVTKYESQRLVHFSHIFPCALWALIIPFQFHPRIRKTFPKLHRFSGRVMVYASHLIIFGIVVIFFKGLSYENDLHPDSVRGKVLINMTLHVPIIQNTDTSLQLLLSPSQVVINSTALPFLYTITKAVKYAKEKDYTNHQIWIVRHVPWGLWVAAQRLLVGCMAGLYEVFVGKIHAPDHVKGRTFFCCGIVATIICVGVAEYTVSLLRQGGIGVDVKTQEKSKKCI